MKTHQQIKSLECETSLINLKELAKKENNEVADRKVKCNGIIKGLLYCIRINFFRSVQLIYIAYANKS